MSLQTTAHDVGPIKSQGGPSPAVRALAIERGAKLVRKVAWSALGATAPAVQIRELHRRRVVAPAGDIIEYVRMVDEPAIIEPLYGYIITCRGVLIEESMQANSHPKAAWRHGLPDPSLGGRLRRGFRPEALRFKRVIFLRHWWEWNYYHFFIDVLGKLNLLDSVAFDPDTPIILGPYAKELSWVPQILGHGGLSRRPWIVPEGACIMAEQVIYCRTQQDVKERMDPILDALDVPLGMDQFADRLFLNRGSNSARQIVNLEEVSAVLERYDFRTVDSATMSIQEKIETFSKTRHLVALCGAGTTNMLFRRDAPLDLLELHSRLYPPLETGTSSGRICRAYGYHWDRLTGEPEDVRDLPIHGNFYISPAALEEKLRAWLG